MGILKHIILPLYSALFLFMGYGWLVKEDVKMLQEGWGDETNATLMPFR
jgi:hypothetical protein